MISWIKDLRDIRSLDKSLAELREMHGADDPRVVEIAGKIESYKRVVKATHTWDLYMLAAFALAAVCLIVFIVVIW
jgi:hypothetical protein